MTCRCGSGADPRRCALHPEEYDRHAAAIDAERFADDRCRAWIPPAAQVLARRS